jgi:hypothetical protein
MSMKKNGRYNSIDPYGFRLGKHARPHNSQSMGSNEINQTPARCQKVVLGAIQ